MATTNIDTLTTAELQALERRFGPIAVQAGLFRRLQGTARAYSADAAPTEADDEEAGYDVGATWVDTDGAAVYVHTGAGVWSRTDNASADVLDAEAAPTVDDDETDGYSVGSTWVDVVAGNVYVCTDPTEGAAVWRQVDSPVLNAYGEAGAPTVDDDETAGFVSGSVWTTDAAVYVCTDPTEGAAVWVRIGAAAAADTTFDGTATGLGSDVQTAIESLYDSTATAHAQSYDHTTSGLAADTTGDAIDELDGRLDALEDGSAPAGAVVNDLLDAPEDFTVAEVMTVAAGDPVMLVRGPLGVYLEVMGDPFTWSSDSGDDAVEIGGGGSGGGAALYVDQAGQRLVATLPVPFLALRTLHLRALIVEHHADPAGAGYAAVEIEAEEMRFAGPSGLGATVATSDEVAFGIQTDADPTD